VARDEVRLAEEVSIAGKTRALYLGAGAPHAAVNGMDVVSRIHINELLASEHLEVTGLVVASALDGRHDRGAHATIGGIRIIIGDPVEGVSRGHLIFRKLSYAIAGCGAMFAFSFRSAEARRLISRAIRSRDHDVVVVDHFATLANISIWGLWQSRIPIVYIAHDVTPTQIRDIGRLKRGSSTPPVFIVEAIKAGFYERMLLKISRTVVFLSGFDRNFYGPRAAHAETLIPVSIQDQRREIERPTNPTLLFVGSPRFSPNGFAINWLVREFAPLLYRSDPSVRILLAGSGTEQVQHDIANVVGLGFVPDNELHIVMDSAVGIICPIIHGSGIKVKVLEAIARGCLVLATEEALRGLDDFKIQPLLDVKDPNGSVERVMRLVADPAYATHQRTCLVASYRAYCGKRQGQLANIVRRVNAASNTPKAEAAQGR
jgi:glycosyltransferase involved in cell wall biosynthesis